MMVIPCDGPAYIEEDNKYIFTKTIVPDYTLNNNNQRTACHFLSQVSAWGQCITTYVNTHDNEAGILTKKISSGDKRNCFLFKNCTIFTVSMQ